MRLPVMLTRSAVAALRRPPLVWTLLGCAVLLAVRRFDQVQTPQFWAEDGPVFFLHARTFGALALLEPAAGYYHSALRLVAWLATFVDVSLAPAVYVAAAAGLTLYVATRTQSERFPFPASPLYAFAVVLIPDGYEVLLNLTNVQWILAAGLILVLISREPADLPGRLHDVLAVGVLGLTGPFIIVLAPLFIWRAWQRRSKFSLLLAAASAGCALLQTLALLAHSKPGAARQTVLELLLAVPGTRIGGSLFTGGELDASSGWILSSVVGGSVVVAVVILAVRKGVARNERMWLGCAFLGLLAAALQRCGEVLPALLNAGEGGRYFYLPQLLVVWLLIVVLHEASGAWRWGAAMLLVGAVAANVDRMQEPALLDLDWQFYAAHIRAGDEVVININPPPTEFTVAGRRPTAAAAKRIGLPSAGLVNASVRSFVAESQPACLGFVIQGRSRKVLLRAVGSSLRAFGVAEPLAEPELSLMKDGIAVPGLFARSGTVDAEIKAASASCGAFPLSPSSTDVVALIELPPGAYSALVHTRNARGEVLLEVYEVPHCWYPGRETRRNRRKVTFTHHPLDKNEAAVLHTGAADYVFERGRRPYGHH